MMEPSGKQELIVTEGGERLDKWLAQRRPDLSRAALQRLIAEGAVTVNGRAAKASYRVQPGDCISLAAPAPRPVAAQPENIPLRIIYEDADVLVVDKPAGLVVHPAAGHPSGTLVNAVLARVPELQGMGDERPGIVHRLDRDTSGVLVVAKNERALRYLTSQFKARTTEKTYLALVHGHVSPGQGVIEAPVGRDPRHRQKMAIVAGGREASTAYRVVRYVGAFTLLEAMPHTGRTHQIRVHLAGIGHPVAGDRVYGPKQSVAGLERQFLHAARLRLRLPSSGDMAEFTSPLPADLAEVLERLES